MNLSLELRVHVRGDATLIDAANALRRLSM